MAATVPLSAADIAVIVVYIVGVICVGVWSTLQAKRGTISGYFLAGRFMTFIPVGMSLFASNIGSEHLVGLAGSGAAGGIGAGAFELNALVFLQMLGFIFLPVYISSGVYTLPEYMHKRFGGSRIRIFLSILSILLYIFTKISVNMYSGALFIQQSVGWNLYVSIFGLLALTGICTVTGGLAAVIYLDTLMALVMVGGALIMTFIGFNQIGWYGGLRNTYVNAVADEVLLGNTTCGLPRADSFQMLREPWHSDIPWLGFLIGQSTASIWYWCADQVIVQRALASKSLSHAQGASILAGYLKLFPLFIMLMPGMISRVLFPNEVACVDPDKCFEICQSRVSCTNIALPKMVLGIMPSGLRGMMLAVMMAALMSDLTSIFNSASTLFTMDIYKIFRRKAETRELMIVGRVAVVVLCITGVLWVPVLLVVQGGQLFLYIQAVSSYFAPPIAAVYLLAIFWKRANEPGVFWAMFVGFIVGIIRMGMDFSYPAPSCGEVDLRPAILKNVHFFYMAFILFFISVLVCVVVSLLTPPPDPDMIIRTTVWTKYDTTCRMDEKIDEKILADDQNEFTIQEGSSYDDIRAPESPRGRWKSLLYCLCGLGDTNDEESNVFRGTVIIEQSTTVKRILRANSLFLILLSAILIIYFTVPDGGPTAPSIDLPYLPFVINGTRPNFL